MCSSVRPHQLLKTQQSRQQVGVGVSQHLGFFHHLPNMWHVFIHCVTSATVWVGPDPVSATAFSILLQNPPLAANYITAASHVTYDFEREVRNRFFLFFLKSWCKLARDSQCSASAWRETASTAAGRHEQSRRGRRSGGAARRPRRRRRRAALVQRAAPRKRIRRSWLRRGAAAGRRRRGKRRRRRRIGLINAEHWHWTGWQQHSRPRWKIFTAAVVMMSLITVKNFGSHTVNLIRMRFWYLHLDRKKQNKATREVSPGAPSVKPAWRDSSLKHGGRRWRWRDSCSALAAV